MGQSAFADPHYKKSNSLFIRLYTHPNIIRDSKIFTFKQKGNRF